MAVNSSINDVNPFWGFIIGIKLPLQKELLARKW